ncbi:hypothetical protein [Armatimonas sp.]|uniref:hypothetical protein n=1 Tax=Armatimonas sp. TaxID=1872638 RepID=UPI00286B408E|nr:hypothetical protein [Armatimonas sp.]
MNLPPALARWAEPLAVLDPVLASALGPLLTRLAAAFGPLRGETRKGGEEPDGYAGITRRGKLEHLLTTEWGLLDTAPDEFLRRLSQGELSFLEPERKANAHERRCLILFDSGPEQLGAPRIAQLAAWIVLAQRASAIGATLQWASLDSEPKESALYTGFDEATVRAFLWSRTATQATPRQLYDWRKFAEEALGSPEELWLLGGPRWLDIPMARGVHLMSTEETEDGEALALTLRPSNRKLQLALPPPDTQIRLLRDPFTPVGAKPGKARVSHRQAVGALVWLPGGKFVCARDSADTGVLVFPIPAKLGASLGPAKLYQQHYARIRAIGGHNNAIFCVAKGGDQLEIRLIKGSCTPFPNKPVALGEADKNLFGYASAELALAVLSFENQLQGELILSFSPLENTPEYWKKQERLTLSLRQEQETGRLRPHWSPVLYNLQTMHAPGGTPSILRVEATDGASFLGDGTQGSTLYWLGKITRAILFSGPSQRESVVLQREDGRWYLPLESKDVAFPALDSDDTVLGATYFGGQVRLVTLSEAGRIVRLVGLGGTKTITGIGGKIVSAAVSPDVPLLACLRESGDLMIWDLETNSRRCQFHAPRETFEEVAVGHS